ncbi:hypothetical protein M4D55_25055 [Metabacillus idriensis]|uniref:phage tail assembly chaperone G n=1 Tax=Metabacillus idriensis TaxID=324768 RepID=UPI00174BD19E|nr:hypothetical protein [Metabacillus idriensis]MCM3599010.1 hypothetical protein [Metabacillus idriensis]
MKKIELLINGEKKVFTVPFVSGWAWRKYIEAQVAAEDLYNLTEDEFDNFAYVVVFAFNEQFTLEEFYKGIPYTKIMSTVEGLFTPPKGEGTGKK